MKDPFFPPPPGFQSLIEPFAQRWNLPTLPLHAHEILLAFTAYHLILTRISPYLSAKLFPKTYPHLNPKTKLNWDVHVVSLVQAIFISGLALYVIANDEERMVEHRVFGYTGAGGALQGFAAGYFVWDLVLSVLHFDIFGPGFTAHAVSALAVFMLGFRPFVNYYGPVFILFELSNPFLNFHWFFDKLKMTGGRAQLINGLLLIVTFFSCRVAWGTYNAFLVFSDIYQAYTNPPAEIVAAGKQIPAWLGLSYLLSNTILNCLNYYWFSRMIITLRARFKKPTEELKKKVEKREKEDEVVVVEGSEVDMTTTALELKEEIEGLERKNRKGKTRKEL